MYVNMEDPAAVYEGLNMTVQKTKSEYRELSVIKPKHRLTSNEVKYAIIQQEFSVGTSLLCVVCIC